MNKNVPPAAALLLDFIAGFESTKVFDGGYDVLYGHHEKALATPITELTLASLLAKQDMWGRMWGSSAAGRYQIMPTTLRSLIADMKLSGNELFSPDMQDLLAFKLLERRGYNSFVGGIASTIGFALQLAQEWASLPVLAPVQGAHIKLQRGQSYYENDGLNHAGVAPEQVEAVLAQVKALAAAQGSPQAPLPIPKAIHPSAGPTAASGAVVAAGAGAITAGAPWPIVFGAVVFAIAAIFVGFTLYKSWRK
jgi:muramidase (phage lysozyme)